MDFYQVLHAVLRKDCCHFSIEAITALVLEAQKQFNFTHILTGAGAFGKVSYS